MKKKHNFRGKLVFSIFLVFSVFIFSPNVYAEGETKECTTENGQTNCDISDAEGGILNVVFSPDKEICQYPDKKDKNSCLDAVKKCKNVLVSEVTSYNIKANLVKGKIYYNYTLPKNSSIDGNMQVLNNGVTFASGNKVDQDERYNMLVFSAKLKPTITYKISTGESKDIECRGEFQQSFMLDSTTPKSGTGMKNPACKEKTGICRKYHNGENIFSGKNANYNRDNMAKYGSLSIKRENGTTPNYVNFEQYLNENFPYCDCSTSKNVSYKLSDNYIKDTILLLAETYEYNYKNQEKLNNISETTVKTITFSSDAIDLDKLNIGNKLNFTCDAFGPTAAEKSAVNNGIISTTNSNGITTPKYAEIKSENTVVGYNNVRKFAKRGPVKDVTYNRSDDTTPKVCSVQCGEEVEVSYGPPVAVRGTVCFEYLITVKSKIQCESKVYAENAPKAPQPETREVCDLEISCSNRSSFLNWQAGPNEDFDKCVKDKFNGKYTQKAINYCYKKVYKKSNKNKVGNTLDDIVAKKVSDSSDCPWWNNSDELKKIDPTTKNGRKTIQDVVDALQSSAVDGRTAGKYEPIGKDDNFGFLYKWTTKGNCYWDRYADIYKYDTETVTALVNDDEIFAAPTYNPNRDRYTGCNAKGNPNCAKNIDNRIAAYQNVWKNKTYETKVDIASHMFYRARQDGIKASLYIGGYRFPGSTHSYAKWNPSGTCQENCKMYSTKQPPQCVMPGDNSDTPLDNDKWKKYDTDLKNYNTALATCAATAKCTEGEKITYYTMEVNDNKTTKLCEGNGDKSANCTAWKENKEKSNPTVEPTDKGYNILVNADGMCYTNGNGAYHYINTISFPGYWIDTGKNQIYRNPTTSQQRFLKFMKNSYCVDPKHPDVNKDWWNWDQKGRKDPKPTSENKTDKIGVTYTKVNPTQYNIKGKFENFGYLDWDLDFSCFFAVNTTTPPTTGKEESTIENIYTRAVGLDEMFPNQDSSTKDVSSNKNYDDIVPKKLSNNKTTEEKTAVKVADTKSDRKPGYNWTCDATDLTIKGITTGASKDQTSDYVIAPSALRYKIETKNKNETGGTYSETPDYHIELTADNIKNIKNTYKDKDYFELDNMSSMIEKHFMVGTKETSILFYKSNLLRTKVKSFNGKAKDKYCNNVDDNGNCDNLKDAINAIKSDPVYGCEKLREG